MEPAAAVASPATADSRDGCYVARAFVRRKGKRHLLRCCTVAALGELPSCLAFPVAPFRRAYRQSPALPGPADPAGTRAAAFFHFHEQTELTRPFVGNLPCSATGESVRTPFAPHGAASSLALVYDRETGRAPEHGGGQRRYRHDSLGAGSCLPY